MLSSISYWVVCASIVSHGGEDTGLINRSPSTMYEPGGLFAAHEAGFGYQNCSFPLTHIPQYPSQTLDWPRDEHVYSVSNLMLP